MSLPAFNQRFDDIHELGEAIGWDLDFRQLDCGEFAGEITALADPDAVIIRVRLNRAFHEMGGALPGARSFGMLAEETVPFAWCSGEVTADHLAAFDSPNGFDGVTPAGHFAYVFSISDTALAGALANAGTDPATLDDIPPQVKGRNGALRRELAELFAAVDAGTTSNVAGMPRIGDLITEALTERLSTQGYEQVITAARRLQICRRAVDYIEASAADAVTVADVCTATGVSLSTLERAFRERFGVPPKRFIIYRRLNGLRRELQGTTQTTVVDAANRWGFWHLGQLARDYRKVFGELPSATLARSS